MSRTEVKYAIKTKYIGGPERDWLFDTAEEANKRWKFLTERASIEWAEIFTLTMTIVMDKVARWEAPMKERTT